MSSGHLDFSTTYNNHAAVCGNIGRLNVALEYFNPSLSMKTKRLPMNRPGTALTFKNIGLIYEMKEDFSHEKSLYDKAALIHRRTLSSVHCNVIQIEKDLERISMKIKQYTYR